MTINFLGLYFQWDWWAVIGLIGQGLSFSRWIVQLISSEKKGKSEIPILFWFFSLIGGFITLIYAIHLKSFAITMAQLFGILVYIRNIYLIFFKKK